MVFTALRKKEKKTGVKNGEGGQPRSLREWRDNLNESREILSLNT
jgi:hypothetical protein